jgi:hypothetical protein
MNQPRFSLASIFLLICVAAVCSAGIRATVTGDPDGPSNGLGLLVGLLVLTGLLVGLYHGLQQARKVVGLFVGGFSGLVSGFAAATMAASSFGLLTALSGSVLLLVFTYVVRRFSNRSVVLLEIEGLS